MAELLDPALLLQRYLALFPAEKERLSRLQRQLAAGSDPAQRTNYQGHLTGSAIILSPERQQVLLIHHKLFQTWQQPGGHYEADGSLRRTAEREAVEETGVRLGCLLPVRITDPDVPLDIDVHPVPARPEKSEPDHWHYDVRYAFVAADISLKHQAEEVNAARWFSVDAPETLRIAPVLLKMKNRGLL